MQKTERPWFSWYLIKYLSHEVVFSFFSGTTIFLFIMLMFQAIRLSEFVVVHQVGLWDVGRLSIFLMSSFLPIAIPIAFLFAILMGISRANSEGEMLALQVNGISPLQVFSPIAVFSFLVTLVCLYTSMYTVPKGNRSFELLITKLSSERVMATLKSGVFTEGFYGLVLFAEQVVPVKNELKKIFIYDDREENRPLAINAQAGILKSTPEKGILTLRLSNGSIHVENPPKREVHQKIDFDVYDINLEIGPRGEAWRGYSPQSYNYDQLRERLRETEPDPPTHRQLQVEYHRRFALSFSCLVFGALGFFIGVLSHRGMRSTSIILCLLVGLVYWISYVVAIALANMGFVAPWLGIWAPNLVFGILSYYLYQRYLYPQ